MKPLTDMQFVRPWVTHLRSPIDEILVNHLYRFNRRTKLINERMVEEIASSHWSSIYDKESVRVDI